MRELQSHHAQFSTWFQQAGERMHATESGVGAARQTLNTHQHEIHTLGSTFQSTMKTIKKDLSSEMSDNFDKQLSRLEALLEKKQRSSWLRQLGSRSGSTWRPITTLRSFIGLRMMFLCSLCNLHQLRLDSGALPFPGTTSSARRLWPTVTLGRGSFLAQFRSPHMSHNLGGFILSDVPTSLMAKQALKDMVRPVIRGLTGHIYWLWVSAIHVACGRILLELGPGIWSVAETHLSQQTFHTCSHTFTARIYVGWQMDRGCSPLWSPSRQVGSTLAWRALEQWKSSSDQALGCIDTNHCWHNILLP